MPLRSLISVDHLVLPSGLMQIKAMGSVGRSSPARGSPRRPSHAGVRRRIARPICSTSRAPTRSACAPIAGRRGWSVSCRAMSPTCWPRVKTSTNCPASARILWTRSSPLRVAGVCRCSTNWRGRCRPGSQPSTHCRASGPSGCACRTDELRDHSIDKLQAAVGAGELRALPEIGAAIEAKLLRAIAEGRSAATHQAGDRRTDRRSPGSTNLKSGVCYAKDFAVVANSLQR